VIEYHPVPGQSWRKLKERFADFGFEEVDHIANIGVESSGVAWLVRSD